MKLVVAFIEMLGFISFQQSKGLIPHKLYIIKTIALPRSKNPELSYQTHASATEIFTLTEMKCCMHPVTQTHTLAQKWTP